MTPQVMEVVIRAIRESNQKRLAEALEDGIAIGRSEGRSEAMEEFALALRDTVDINELSRVTGLTVDEINKL